MWAVDERPDAARNPAHAAIVSGRNSRYARSVGVRPIPSRSAASKTRPRRQYGILGLPRFQSEMVLADIPVSRDSRC